MAIMDRFRDAWEDLRGIPKEQQEPALVERSAAEYRPPSTEEVRRAVDELFRSARQELQPALQTLADERYQGRLDLLPAAQELQVVTQVAERSGIPVDVARVAASEVITEAYKQQVQGESQRLSAAVGEKHADEVTFREKTGEVWTYDHHATGQQVHLDAKGKFYDIEEGQTPKQISREEILGRFQNTPESASADPEDHRRKWEQLEKAVGYHGADRFEHYAQEGNVHIYRQTIEEQDRFIGLDSKGRFYEVDQSDFNAIARVSRESALRTVEDSAHFYTPAEATPTHKDWSRLEQAVGKENAVNFTFRGEAVGVQTFEHDQTGGHVRLDPAGQFRNAEHQPIARDVALAQALPRQAVEAGQAIPAEPESSMKTEALSREQSIGM